MPRIQMISTVRRARDSTIVNASFKLFDHRKRHQFKSIFVSYVAASSHTPRRPQSTVTSRLGLLEISHLHMIRPEHLRRFEQFLPFQVRLSLLLAIKQTSPQKFKLEVFHP